MSDLSFLIQNQNEVKVDESFLQKFQKKSTKIQKKPSKQYAEKDTPKKQIKLKKKMTQIEGKKKKFPIKSYTSQHFPDSQSKNNNAMNPQSPSPNKSNSPSAQQNNKYFDLVDKKIASMLLNQKNMQDEISSQLFEIKYTVQYSEQNDKHLQNMLQKTKCQIKRTKKGIGQIINLIQKHSYESKCIQEYAN